ncbi:unnamed protein product [Bursaphelenchus xylophilus]|uniref:(pine wood nematode) hypothetical protein n=1 Tax=Bursaphelenchus xylophilus TaxID=6326 RepID=A0A1I7SSM2_BURXY|nr:unnamed protein product [Bursaphelenchus xylophilus]CAG9097408.1 unnamed protein product [Bursaphelenchus xylophilus]
MGLLFVLLVLFTIPVDGEDLKQCWASENGGPARFWPNGEIIFKDEFLFQCFDGNLEPYGCRLSNGEILFLNEQLIVDDKVVKCTYFEYYIDLVEVGCAIDGITVIEGGKSWIKDGVYYICNESRGHYHISPSACVLKESDEMIRIGETVNIHNYTLQCQPSGDGKLKLVSTGCLNNGKRYKIGDQWTEDGFVFYCKKKSNECVKKCVGCSWDNKTLYNGDRFTKDKCVFECVIRPERHIQDPVGCLFNGIEKVVGCMWKENMGSFRTELTCASDGEKSEVIVNGCHYPQGEYDLFFIPSESYAIFNDGQRQMVAACRGNKNDVSTFQLETFTVDELPFRTKGLTQVEPQG